MFIVIVHILLYPHVYILTVEDMFTFTELCTPCCAKQVKALVAQIVFKWAPDGPPFQDVLAH